MFLTIILFILGFIFLIKGANILVDGSSSIAKRFGLSTFFIGLTIVAFGTSTPELVISVVASIKGSAGIALGNVLGSNISNTLLILGLSAIVTPLLIKRETVNKAIPFSLLATLAVVILANDIFIDGDGPNGLTRIDGLVLMLFFIIFIYYTFGIKKVKKDSILHKTAEQFKSNKNKEHKNYISVFMIVIGLAGLIIGGRWIVNGAIFFAETFKVSEALIGLTIVAIGTSLPELAVSALAAKKGQTDMAVGNIIGSNIFNLLWVLGLSAVIRPISYGYYLNVDTLVLICITIILIPLIYIGRRNILGRQEGIFLVTLYIFYIIFLFYRG